MPTLLEELGLNILFARSPDALLLVECPSGRVDSANTAACELLESTETALTCRKLVELVADDDREATAAGLARFEEGTGDLAPIEASLCRSDRSTFPCEWFAWPAQADGQRYLVAQFRDLSAQRRALEEIRLRNVAIASLSSGVAIADARLPDIPLIYVNKGFENITGYKAREAVGRSCRFLQGTDRDQAGLDILRHSITEGVPCEVRLRNQRKNGELFWNELHISPVRDSEGHLTHFVGIQIDVTDKVESRLRLEESEERYRTLAESMEDLVVRSARDGTIEFLSPSCRQHLGSPPEDWLGKHFQDLVHPSDRERVTHALHELQPGDPARQLNFRLRSPTAQETWMEATTTAVSEHDRPPYLVSVVRDITLRRKAEEDIRSALERERELNLIKTGFIRMVSHEFRTPMTGIGASTAFLSQYGEQLTPEKRTRHFKNIERSLARMNQLLDDVLFVSRSESGRIPFAGEPVDVPAFCEQLIDETLVAFTDREIRLETQFPNGHCFLLDPNLIHHIMQNLLGNALKYSPADEPVRVSVEHSESDASLRWTVEDHGIGIPREAMEHLFEPFQRADNVSTVSGTGLGLYIAQHSAELHGGRISVESSLDKGSAFTLVLPAVTAPLPENSHA